MRDWTQLRIGNFKAMAFALGALAIGAASLAAGVRLVPSVQAAPALKEVVFAPHRAIYDLSLESAKSGSGVAGVNGRIVYELSGNACEGYAQSMRFVTQTLNQEGEIQTTDLRTSSWEEVPALRLRFSTSTYQNDIAADQTQGVAKRTQPNGAVSVDLGKPTRRQVPLSGDIYFPIQHSMAIIQAARAGRTIFAADLFDGSESGDKVYSTSTAIGRQTKPGGGAVISLAKGSADLDRVPSWPVSVSYFPAAQAQGDTIPLYEMSYRFHENGVTSSLTINHGDFSIKGELKELTYFEASPCKVPSP
ncbi:cell envelope integrity EipB family protein [Hyphomicrobium sp.]|uniref:cell envelope integrity EipB family protein n=1 Tax=Hyphomicrobium sp. TaxID=82 RepID=UPI002E375B68|nr:cell envelope integrity EipB family protein [Hyphomicrobium sp.]HEX2842762.1 cell envelope integrity EipB family protein [Hyphomicrobium sp.]